MSKHSFMDTILNRPSQRYTEPDAAKSSSKARYKTPNDLPNAPNKPNSILAGTMFTGAGPDSLNHAAAASYSRAPSVMSVKSNTSRFSIFRKKNSPAFHLGRQRLLRRIQQHCSHRACRLPAQGSMVGERHTQHLLFSPS